MVYHLTSDGVLQVIAAEGEQKASSALKDAAEVIQQSPHALQVSRGYWHHFWRLFLNYSSCDTCRH